MVYVVEIRGWNSDLARLAAIGRGLFMVHVHFIAAGADQSDENFKSNG